MKKLLHTPEGVRDIYNVECGKKLALESRLKKTLHLYGYHDIQTPMFEYSEVFRKEIGTIPSKDLYKFFDKEGNTLALRPDITPSVARAASTLFADETLPIRLCYTGNTFINHSSYQGRLREVTQMGAELLGDDSIEADAEMLAMVIEALLAVGVKEFQINVGNVDFFQSLMEDASLEEEERERVLELIGNRNYFGLQEYLESIAVTRSVKEAFVSLGELTGGVEILAKAKNLAPNSSGIMAVKRLEKIYDMLALYGQKLRIVYTRKNTLILYDDEVTKKAVALAQDLRKKAKNVEMIKKAKDRLLEEYVEYGREYYAGNLIYLKKTEEITMVNLVTGEHKIVNGQNGV